MSWNSLIRRRINMSHHAVTLATGGGTPQIFVKADELTTIFQKLEEIIMELEANVNSNIAKLGTLNYYEEGKAKKAMEVYAEANQKMQDLFDNYFRASTLVIDTLNTMIETDQLVAERIIARLGV